MATDIEKTIVRILENRVSEEEMRTFRTWLDASEENKKLFFELKRIYDYRTEQLSFDDQALEASWRRLYEKLKNNPHAASADKQKNRLQTTARRWSMAAAVATLLIVGAALFSQLHRTKPKEWVEIHNPPRSLPQSIELPDGSRVQLNASSALKYPKKFNRNRREIHLDGEALFEVVSNAAKPFTVHAGNQKITVLGTRFNVMNYSSDNFSATTLIDGKIELKTLDERNNITNRIVMTPDEQLCFDKETGKITVNTIDTDDIVSWTQGIYTFYDAPLQQITERLEKMYGTTILIADSESRNEKYTGKFSFDQRIEEIIRIINFDNRFGYVMRNDTIILEKK